MYWVELYATKMVEILAKLKLNLGCLACFCLFHTFMTSPTLKHHLVCWQVNILIEYFSNFESVTNEQTDEQTEILMYWVALCATNKSKTKKNYINQLQRRVLLGLEQKFWTTKFSPSFSAHPKASFISAVLLALLKPPR